MNLYIYRWFVSNTNCTNKLGLKCTFCHCFIGCHIIGTISNLTSLLNWFIINISTYILQLLAFIGCVCSSLHYFIVLKFLTYSFMSVYMCDCEIENNLSICLEKFLNFSDGVRFDSDNHECSLTSVAFVWSRDRYLNFLQFLFSFLSTFYHILQTWLLF